MNSKIWMEAKLVLHSVIIEKVFTDCAVDLQRILVLDASMSCPMDSESAAMTGTFVTMDGCGAGFYDTDLYVSVPLPIIIQDLKGIPP